MNILHLTLKPIFPIVDGGCMAMYRLLSDLYTQDCTIKNLSVATPKHPFKEEAFPTNIRKHIRPEAIYINTNIKYFSAIRSLFSNKSYNVSRFDNKEFKVKLKEILQSETFDAIILESVYMLPNIDLIRQYSQAKVLLRTHNVEFELWEQQAQQSKNPINKWAQAKLAKNLKKYEVENIAKVDGIASISEDIIEKYRELGTTVPMINIPLSLETHPDDLVDYSSSEFHFLGALNWQPNIEALNFLKDQLFPEINNTYHLHVAGSFTPEELLSLDLKNITFHGKVENPADFVSQHGTMLLPIFTGSGVRIKLLEALSIGVPVISTNLGVEGAGKLVKDVHYLEANNVDEFKTQMKRIAEDTELKKAIGQAGKKFIEDQYSKESISKKLIDFINNI